MGGGLPSVNHCVSKALLLQQPGSRVMTVYVYYCIIVYIDSQTSKSPLAWFHKMLVRENSNEQSKTVLAQVIFVCHGTSKLQWVCSYGLFLYPFPLSVSWIFSSPVCLFFYPCGICWHHTRPQNIWLHFSGGREIIRLKPLPKSTSKLGNSLSW